MGVLKVTIPKIQSRTGNYNSNMELVFKFWKLCGILHISTTTKFALFETLQNNFKSYHICK